MTRPEALLAAQRIRQWYADHGQEVEVKIERHVLANKGELPREEWSARIVGPVRAA